MTHQYTLPIAIDVPYAVEEYIISSSNKTAHSWITRWPNWPDQFCLLYGPEASGKTHLAHVWAEKAGALFIEPVSLAYQFKEHAAYVVEDIEHADEELLFHLWNRLRELQCYVLFTTGVSQKKLSLQTNDLRSRINSMTAVKLEHPDDALLIQLIHKQFADRQLKVQAGVAEYILNHTDRTVANAYEIIRRLDQSALAEKRNITIPFIKQCVRLT